MYAPRALLWFVVITHPLAHLLSDAALGIFPVPDGTVAVVPAPRPYRAAVIAFTAHSIVATDLAINEVRAHLPDKDFGASVSAAFLSRLSHELGTNPGASSVHLGKSERDLALMPHPTGKRPSASGACLETSAEAAMGQTLGRAMISAARAVVPPDEPVFAQVSPGNARSLPAFLAARFRPIGSEVLFV